MTADANGETAIVVPTERRARCSAHPTAPSARTCAGCGLFLCEPCGEERAGRCVRCSSEGHPIPWEDGSVGAAKGFFATVRGLARSNAFFREAPWTGGLKRPLVFAMLCAVIGALGKGITVLLIALPIQSDWLASALQRTYAPLARGNRAFETYLASLPAQLDQFAETLARSAFSGVALSPLEAAFSLFVLAALTHPVARWLGGKGTFEGTFRVLAYANAAQVIKLIPVLGLPLAMIGGLLLTVVGMRRAHGLSGGKSLLAALWWVPFAVLIVLLFSVWAFALMIKVAFGR